MRALRIGLVILVVLAGLFVAADRIAVNLAEDEVAKKLKSQLGSTSSGDPSVSIEGFPFLTQIAGKDLDKVTVEVEGVTATASDRQVRLSKVNMTAEDVKLSDNYGSAVADRATGTVHLSYADLSKAADDGVRVGYGGKSTSGKDQVKVTASVALPLVGRAVERSVYSTVSVSGGDTVRLHADKVPGSKVPGVEEAIRKKIDFEREIDSLPDGLKLEKVEATKDGVDVSMAGTGVNLAG
ncbi:LmeA family phospholipid-binding protein [Streptomyces sp. 8N114]|uniref:LmeA family phospholipid-binding protein n=1 Tax=Streptomyces sp. 8N114 TaxID=3457419 RepID=UPI003FD3E71C